MREPAEPPDSSTEPKEEVGGAPARILVVDDDAPLRELIVAALKDRGYGVVAADSAEAAVIALHRGRFDLVLSDVSMPGMDGIALSSMLSHTHPDLPVVLITGNADVHLAREALQRGATDFVTKPFKITGLAVIVERNLERHRLERERILQQDDRALLNPVVALAAAIDAKQAYTAEHSRRVAELARIVGAYIGLDSTELRYLEIAAQVHDVGKIGVPDHILNKDGGLTDDEWAVMRMHSEKGADIVGQVSELGYVSDIVRHHHERIDGGGYPDGLQGESIPLLSRVIAVCDAYECMTSDRVYRAKLPIVEAICRLQEASGKQFDAAVVSAFLELHQQGKV